MFTGLIEAIGEVTARTATTGGQRISIRSPLAAELSLGDSVAVNGVCLTVVQTDAAFHADVGPETLRVTTLGSLEDGALVNLERPLRGDGRMGGPLRAGARRRGGSHRGPPAGERFSLADGEFSDGAGAGTWC